MVGSNSVFFFFFSKNVIKPFYIRIISELCSKGLSINFSKKAMIQNPLSRISVAIEAKKLVSSMYCAPASVVVRVRLHSVTSVLELGDPIDLDIRVNKSINHRLI